MNLPDQQLLEDAEWQLSFATQLLAPFLATLQQRTETPPTDPALRARYDQTTAMLRALALFFSANEALISLLREREEEMNGEMAAANFRYRQMRLERDFAVSEARIANRRYYDEKDLFTLLTANA